MPFDPRSAWALDPSVTFLNHGSFGACPRAVLERQTELRARMEAEPIRFFVREAPRLLDEAIAEVAAFVGAPADDVVFVPNATTAVNAVLRSLRLEPGDELLVCDHAYPACENALRHVAQRTGARVVTAHVPFPLRSVEEVERALFAAAAPRTRLALLDHVTSPTALVLPLGRIVEGLAARGVDALVDGAHAPGMLPLDVASLGAAYYTGNLHKWTCAPKGAAFLYVRPDRQAGIAPTTVSHGASSPRTDRSRMKLLFDWTGTQDLSPYLCAPVALRVLAGMVPGGWPTIMRRNRDLALRARDLLASTLGVPHPAPDEMLGAMASLPLPEITGASGRRADAFAIDPLQASLDDEEKIVAVVARWPGGPGRLLRVSAALYNTVEDFERLAAALRRRGLGPA